jgi:hypothetical protein
MKIMKRLILFVPVLVLTGILFTGCASVTSIVITSGPRKTVYGQGQDLDLTGLTVNGTYSNDKVKPVRVTAANITGYNKHQSGEQTVTIRSGEGSATFRVTVKPLLRISLIRGPAKNLYKQGETLDLLDIQLQGTWEELGTEKIQVTRDMVSMYELASPGEQTISVHFEGQQVSFPITVVPMSSIAVRRPPSKLAYKQGEDLDLTDLLVVGIWEGIGTEQITVDKDNISGFDTNIIGQQVITITVGEVSTSFNISVKGLMTLQVSTPPNKRIYDYGENLDLSGLVVVGTFSDNSQERIPIRSSYISNYDSRKAGEQTVVITIYGRRAVFMVQVRALNSIAVQRAPNKGVYEPGEALDLTGMVVVGTYSDSSTRVIPGDRVSVSGFDSYKPGQQTIIVSAEGKQSSFTLTVLPKRSYDSTVQ